MADFFKKRKNQYLLTALFLLVVIVSGIAYFNQASRAARNADRSIDPSFSAYISSYTAGVIPRASTIVIRLSQEHADSSDIGVTASRRLFRFTPALRGEALWVDSRTIEYRPDDELKSGTTYEVDFLLANLLDVPREMGIFSFRFQTIRQDFAIELEGLQAYSDRELKRQKLMGTLATADRASDSDVEQMLEARQGDEDLEIAWDHGNDDNRHQFEIQGIIRSDRTDELVVSADGTAIDVERKEQIAVEIPSLGSFEMMEAKVIQSPEQYVSLRFSDPLTEDQDFTGLIEIGGLQDLRYQVVSNELRVYPSVRQAGQMQVRINRGIENIMGYKLQGGTSREILFEQIKPAVRVVGNGVILPGTEGMIFPFEAVNLRAVDIRVIKIYEQNIAQFLQRNSLSGNAELKRVGYPVLRKTLPLGNEGITDFGKWNRYTIELSQLIKAEPGAIYQIQISFRKSYSTYFCEGQPQEDQVLNLVETGEVTFDESEDFSYWDSYEEYYYNPDYQWSERDNPCHSSYYGSRRDINQNILSSDIGIMAKRGDNSALLIGVTDLITAEPLSGVNISVTDFQHQVIAAGTTDLEGFVEMKVDQKPFLIVATHNDQRGYLKLPDGLSLSLSNFDVSGQKVQKGIKGFIYGERGVWRPGDSLHIAFILEDKDRILPKNHPVIFELVNPRNQLDQRIVQSTSVGGIYNFSTKTATDAPTGNWRAVVKVGGATFQKKIKIETVKPNRLKINLDFGRERLFVDQHSITGNLEVRWLHGAVAKNMRAVFDVMLTPIRTTFAGYPNFTFDDPSKNYYSEKIQVFEGTTNALGKATMNIDFGTVENAPGVLRAYFSGQVFEPSGNFSVDRFSIPFYPYQSFVGLQLPEGDKRGMLQTDTTHAVDIVSVDVEGNPISRRGVEMELYKLEWRWWWDHSANDVSNYLGRTHQKPIMKATVNTVNGKARGRFRIDYPEWGRFFIRVTDPVSGHSAGKTFYLDWPGWAGEGKKTFPGSAIVLDFSSDKEAYEVGERVELTIPGADNGRALVSVEDGSKVIQKWWLKTTKGENRFSFKTTPEMTPNVYVFTSLIQPHGNTSNDLPIRMYGVIPIKVKDPGNILEPGIRMGNVLKPEEDVVIEVTESRGNPMSYTIAVVDEGLLDLTRFQTPAPYDVFYAREALGVKTWDLFDEVIGAYGGKLDRVLAIGGDEQAIQPTDQKANRFEPVVKFLGPFYLGKSQTGMHRFRMPNYIGSVRTMVIAAHEGSYGHTEETRPVRKPLMVLSTLPRVLGPSEKVKLPVSVFVMEEGIGEVHVDLEFNEMFEMTGNRRKKLYFVGKGDQMIEFDLSTIDRTGIGKVEVYASAGAEKAHHTIEIEIRNPNPPVTDVWQAMIEVGETWEQNVEAPGLAGSNSASMEISSMPPINLEQRLRYLYNYPHGCIEQVVSAVFPRLYVGDFVDLSLEAKQDNEWAIKTAIAKLQSYQLSNGGFAYWPGAEDPQAWGTSYAGHFLLEAQSKGYDVPSHMLQRWKRFQRNRANQWELDVQYRRGDLTQAYRLYTLALAGEPARGAMNRMMEKSGLTIAARWRLAAAFSLAGNAAVARTITTDLGSDIGNYRELGGNFGSRTRDMAMVLEALALMNERVKGFDLLRRLAEQLSDKSVWMSTQETAYSLIAIGQFVSTEEIAESISCRTKINGSAQTYTTDLPMIRKELAIKNGTNKLVVSNTGKGVVFVRVTATGNPLKGDERDVMNDLGMTLHYRNANGAVIDPSKLDQGQHFQAEISVFNPGLRGTYEQLALAQVFPSGWEILNVRMDETIGSIKQSRPEYQDIRDDRVYTYFNLAPNERKTFVVQLVAAFSGSFYAPSVTCEAMYDKSINARIHGQKVSIQENQVQ